MLTRKDRKRTLEELNLLRAPQPKVEEQDDDDDEALPEDVAQSKNEEDDDDTSLQIPVELLKQYEKSVVKIAVTEFITDPKYPWRHAMPRDTHGTGAVIDLDNGLIITCAHVARFGSVLRVRAANDSIDYPAKVLVSQPDCDLALVQVESPEFLAKVEAAKFGDLQVLESQVVAIGFPITGNELTTTTGIVSSNEFDDYTEGDAFNLISHTDTPINPGNSGGPVFDMNGFQVGVVFQAYTPDSAEHAGQFTPIPVIKQFIEDAYDAIAQGKSPKGIPALPIETECMVNPALLKKYRMTKGQSGIRVSTIDDLAEGKLGGLKVDDVILSIDDHPIQNDGTINTFPNISQRLDYRFLISSKQIGEKIDMKVLRDGKELSLTIPLQYRANELKLVGRKDYWSESSYYIKNGLCFQPGSFTLLADEEVTELGQTFDMKEGHIMAIPKTVPGQEMVLLNCIFDSDKTLGYKKAFMCEPVVSVFGRPIHNMAELIHALETSPSTHSGIAITLKNDDKIVIAKMSPEEDLEVVKPYHITKLCSDNYAPLVNSIRQNLSERASTSNQKQFTQGPVTEKQKNQTSLTKEKLKV